MVRFERTTNMPEKIIESINVKRLDILDEKGGC